MRPLTLGVLVSRADTASSRGNQSTEGSDVLEEAQLLEGHADLQSCTDLSTALRELGFECKPIAVDDCLDLTLRRAELDGCVLALHGREGGLGQVQALLEMQRIPYAGPPPGATSLAFDKVRARQVLAYHNLPTPASLALGGPSNSTARKPTDRAIELLGWPCMVKPRRGALGVGVAPLLEPDQLGRAVGRALAFDNEAVLERALPGLEVQVVVRRGRVLGAMEVHREPQKQYVCPPTIARGELDGLYNLARRAVDALGLDDTLTRVDMMVGDRYNEAILEVEPLPPLHREGVCARVARANGISYLDLVADLVRPLTAMLAHRSRPAPLFLQ